MTSLRAVLKRCFKRAKKREACFMVALWPSFSFLSFPFPSLPFPSLPSPSFFLPSYLLYPGLSSKLRRCQTSLGGVRPRPGPAVRTGAAQGWQGRDCHVFCQPRPMPNQRRHLFFHLFSTGAYSRPKSSPFFEHVFGFGFRMVWVFFEAGKKSLNHLLKHISRDP